MTIRSRLALTYGAAVALTIAVLGLVVWWQFGLALRSSLGQRLETQLAAVEASLEHEEQPGLQDDGEDGDLFVMLLTADGTTLAASANAPRALAIGSATDEPQEVASNGRRYLVTADEAPGGVRIVVGADLAPSERAQSSLAGLLGLAGALATALSAAGGWWLAGRALQPVADMTAEAAAIGASDLSRRLPEPARLDELGILARTLNGMLERIGEAVTRQRSFVASASHDLRTPLSALQTELELADRPDATPDELRGALQAARDDASRLGELAADLLQLATVAGDGQELVLTELDVVDLIDTVLRRVAPVAARAGVTLRTTVDHRTVRLDRVRIEQALANLIINAVTYSPAGEEVVIGTPADSGGTEWLVLEVADHGPGVPVDEREVIFEPFRRGAGARGAGAGLGLATVHGAVAAHAGRVDIADRPGGGAIFRIQLPRRLA